MRASALRRVVRRRGRAARAAVLRPRPLRPRRARRPHRRRSDLPRLQRHAHRRPAARDRSRHGKEGGSRSSFVVLFFASSFVLFVSSFVLFVSSFVLFVSSFVLLFFSLLLFLSFLLPPSTTLPTRRGRRDDMPPVRLRQDGVGGRGDRSAGAQGVRPRPQSIPARPVDAGVPHLLSRRTHRLHRREDEEGGTTREERQGEGIERGETGRCIGDRNE